MRWRYKARASATGPLRTSAITYLLLAGTLSCTLETPAPEPAPAVVIAHRGASGALPEHTLAAYDAAIELGADYVEPDLVLSADGVLVCRHDIYLSTTTDVAQRPEFAERRREVDGRLDWFVDDFTLAELRSLRAIQPFPQRDQSHNGRYVIPTFAELQALVADRQRATGRAIGIYPELKRPDYFGRQRMADLLLEALEPLPAGADKPPVYIQSFDEGVLRYLQGRTDHPLVMLVTGQQDAPGPNIPLSRIAEFAQGVGPAKTLLLGRDGQTTGFVAEAQRLGLVVHPWTFRDDLVPGAFSDGHAELQRYLELGVDGFFTDFPATGVAARDAVQAQ